MPRVKTGFTRRKRHKKILNLTKGYYSTRNRLYKRAHEAFIKAGEYAFFGRKLKKRDFRKLWIIRLNAALRPYDINYSTFINRLNNSKIELNRKILSDLAIKSPKSFEKIVKSVIKK